MSKTQCRSWAPWAWRSKSPEFLSRPPQDAAVSVNEEESNVSGGSIDAPIDLEANRLEDKDSSEEDPNLVSAFGGCVVSKVYLC